MTINFSNTFFGLNQNGASSLFGSSSNASSSSNVFSSLASSFAEVNSTSYKRLLKKYYAEMSDEDSSKNSTVSNLVNNSNTAVADAAAAKELKTDATKLQKSADAITKVDEDGNYTLFGKDRETIDKAVKQFVQDYNELTSAISSSKYSNTRMGSLKSQLNALSSAGQYSLKNIGITAGANGKLVLDEKKYAQASIDTIKEVMTGTNSFTERAAEKAEYIAKNATRYTTDSYGTYNASKNYNIYNTGNLFNGFF